MADDVDAIALARQQQTNDLIALTQHPGFKVLARELRKDKRGAIELLCKADPANTTGIIRLQEIIAQTDSFFDKLEQLIQNGVSDEDEAELLYGDETDD